MRNFTNDDLNMSVSQLRRIATQRADLMCVIDWCNDDDIRNWNNRFDFRMNSDSAIQDFFTAVGQHDFTIALWFGQDGVSQTWRGVCTNSLMNARTFNRLRRAGVITSDNDNIDDGCFFIDIDVLSLKHLSLSRRAI